MKLINIEWGLEFENGNTLRDHHEQDCCEEVYADFDNMQAMVNPFACEGKNELDLKELDFFEDLLSSIVPIDGLGFYIVTKQGICILVSCYDIQNGYYSSNLSLVYKREDSTIIGEMDISQCTTEQAR